MELRPFPSFWALLDLKDAVVSTDAMDRQKAIVDQEGDYLLQLKANQAGLFEEAKLLFDQCLRDDCQGIVYATAAELIIMKRTFSAQDCVLFPYLIVKSTYLWKSIIQETLLGAEKCRLPPRR